jgi:hypothetical protein
MKDLLREDLIGGKILLLSTDANKDARDLARIFGGVPTLIEEEHGEVHQLIVFK